MANWNGVSLISPGFFHPFCAKYSGSFVRKVWKWVLVLLATSFCLESGVRHAYKWITAAAKGEVEAYAAANGVDRKVSGDDCLRIPIEAKNFMIRPNSS
jgi:hypothetical protein